MIPKSKVKRVKSKEFYVDNKKFLAEIIIYRNSVKISLEEYIQQNSSVTVNEVYVKPRVSEYIGECFLNIARKLSNKPNFISYSYKEDMCADGIENSLQYIDNFDPAKSSNPFAYFTQIINYAFIRRIQKEKKQLYVKFRMTEEDFLHLEPFNKKYINDESDERMRSFIQNFEDSIKNKKDKEKEK